MWHGKCHRRKYSNPFRTQTVRSARNFFIIPTLILIATGFYCLFFLHFWNIKIINVHGDYPAASEEIKNTVDNFLNKSQLFPGRHFFLFRAGELTSLMKEKYPLDNVVIDKIFKTRTIDINLSGKQYAALWIARGLIFKIDKKGSVVGVVNNGVTETAIKIYDLDNQVPSINDNVIGQPIMDFIAQYNSSEDGQRYRAVYWEYSKQNDALDMITQSTARFKVYFDHKQPLDPQITTMDRILGQIIKPEEKNKIDYIDLRFGERVYYKLK